MTVESVKSYNYAAIAIEGASHYASSRDCALEVDCICRTDLRDINNLCGGLCISAYQSSDGSYDTGYKARYAWGVTPILGSRSVGYRASFVAGHEYVPAGRIALLLGYTSATWTIGNLTGTIAEGGTVPGKSLEYHALYINNTTTSVGYIRIAYKYAYPVINIPTDVGYDGTGESITISTTDGSSTSTDSLSAYYLESVSQTWSVDYPITECSFATGKYSVYGSNGVLKCSSGPHVGTIVGSFVGTTITFTPILNEPGRSSVYVLYTSPNKIQYSFKDVGSGIITGPALSNGTKYTLKLSYGGIYIDNTLINSGYWWPDSSYNYFVIGAHQNPSAWNGIIDDIVTQETFSDDIVEVRMIQQRDESTQVTTTYVPSYDSTNQVYCFSSSKFNVSSTYQPNSSFILGVVPKILYTSIKMKTQNGLQTFSKAIIKSTSNIVCNASGFIQYNS